MTAGLVLANCEVRIACNWGSVRVNCPVGNGTVTTGVGVVCGTGVGVVCCIGADCCTGVGVVTVTGLLVGGTGTGMRLGE